MSKTSRIWSAHALLWLLATAPAHAQDAAAPPSARADDRAPAPASEGDAQATANASAPTEPRASGDVGRRVDEQGVAALAVKNNPTLKVALSQLENARWAQTGEEGRYGASLLLDGSYTRTEQPQLFNSVLTNFSERYDAGIELRKNLPYGTQLSLRTGGYRLEQESSFLAINGAAGTRKFGPGYGIVSKLSLTQPLLRGRGREVGEAQVRAARVQRTQAEHARDRVASELLRDVLTAYWELWYADRSVAIEQESRGLSERQRDQAAARARTGSLAAADVLSFETQLAQREEALLEARGARLSAEHDLRRLLGLVSTQTSLEVLAMEARLPTALPREQAEQEALAESRQLRELISQLELARLQARTAADPTRSRLDLSAYAQVQGLGNDDIPAALAQYGKAEAFSAFIGLTYEAPLDSRQQRAAAARARISVDTAQQQFAEARDREISQLRIALDRQAVQSERLALVEQTVAIAEKQLAAEQARYATGSSTPLTVIEAENAVRTARLRVARVHADLLTTSLAIEHTTGRLLSRYASELGR